MGKQKVLLPKSSVSGKTPVASAMTYGELYINYASGTNTAFLATKKSDGTIAKFFEGGEINVQPNWSETSTTSDAYILNKPTNLSDFQNDIGLIDSATTDERYVNIASAQTITGVKSFGSDVVRLISPGGIVASSKSTTLQFSNNLRPKTVWNTQISNDSLVIYSGAGGSTVITLSPTNPTVKISSSDVNVNVPVSATSFVKQGGTSKQFLKADGSVDESEFISTSGQTLLLCHNTSGTTALTISGVSNYQYEEGGVLLVAFQNDVPSGATLTINSGPTCDIMHYGTTLQGNVIKAGDTVSFMSHTNKYILMSIDRWGMDLGFNNIQITGVSNILPSQTNGVISFRSSDDIIVSAITSSITMSAQPHLKNAIFMDYGHLYGMVHSSALTVGQVYMITDYVTLVDGDNMFGTYEKPFALLVTAIAEDKLSCIAFAVDKGGYWPSSNLDKWVLWYDIENDNTKYNWANTKDGRGVIYRMIDEFGNDCPYDFKNIHIKHTEAVFQLAAGAEDIIHQGLPIPTFSFFNKGAYEDLSLGGGARDNYIAPQYSGTTLLFPQIAITIGSTPTPAAPSIVKNKFSCFSFGLYSALVSGNTFDDAIECEITANGSVCGNKIGPGFYQNNVLCANYFNNNIIESDCAYCTFSGDQKSRITVSNNVIGNHCSSICALNHWTNNIIHDSCSDLIFQNFSANGNTGGYRYWVVESNCNSIDIYPGRHCPEYFQLVTIRSGFRCATITPSIIYGSVSNPARIVFGLFSDGAANQTPYLEDADTLNSNLTIGNGVLTIQTGATPSLSGGFSANQSSNKSFTFHKVVQTGKVGDLTNDVGYIKSGVTSLTNFATSANVVNAINSLSGTYITSANVVTAINGLSGSYVTLNTEQTITAKKTFASGITINNPSSAIVSDITYTTCGSTCHQQYDGVNKCLKFVFD